MGVVFILSMNETFNKKESSNLILASSSQRRKELLTKAGFTFTIFIPKGEELNIIGKTFSEDLLNDCVKRKAENAYNELILEYKITNTDDQVSNKKIITCDTIVVNDNIIIGKPKNKEDAINILKSLSNKKHFVASAVCVYKNNDYYIGQEKTFITFKDLSIKQIEEYVENYKPFDKAGSYGIQDENFDFVKEIDGNIDNVIGLPMTTLKKLL